MPPSSNELRARAILESIATGTIPMEHFTPDARWWWNGGLDLAVGDFLTLLAQLHAQTVDGIHVRPGLLAERADALFIEATSRGALRNGKIYDNRYVFRFGFRDGRVALVKEYSDTAHVRDVFALDGNPP